MKHSIILIFFSLFLEVLIAGCGSEAEEPEEIIRPVRYSRVTTTGNEQTRTFTGVALTSQETRLSFQVGGRIQTLKVNVGDKIRRGQSLATLDDSDLQLQYKQAVAQQKSTEANLKSAESQLLTTRAAFERVEKLYENNSVSLSEYEQTKGQYEAALAQYDAGKSQVSTAQSQTNVSRNQLRYTRLSAPFNGVITEVLAEKNELISSGNPVVVISAEDRPEVQVGVPESFISRISKGQQVFIDFSAIPSINFTGVVSEVSFSTGSAATYPVVITLSDPSDEIRPGMAANVRFDFQKNTDTIEGNNEPIVPANAVGEDSNGQFVFVISLNDQEVGTVKKRTIKIGQLLPDGFEVTEGLSDGELVATAGLSMLLDGMKVKLLNN